MICWPLRAGRALRGDPSLGASSASLGPQTWLRATVNRRGAHSLDTCGPGIAHICNGLLESEPCCPGESLRLTVPAMVVGTSNRSVARSGVLWDSERIAEPESLECRHGWVCREACDEKDPL